VKLQRSSAFGQDRRPRSMAAKSARATPANSRQGERAPKSGRVVLDLPFAGPTTQKMARIYVLLLFLAPGTLLDMIGYDYSSIGGSQLTKIHISTYFLILLFVVFAATYPNKRALLSYYVSTKLGTIYFFFAATLALINIIIDKRNGFGMYTDTDLHLFLCSMLAPFILPREMDRLETFLHGFFAINGVLAIIELTSGWHAFPLTTFSPDGYTYVEPRATAFLAHPLHAAAITCVYIISLLAGAGHFPKPWMRPGMIALQCAALLAFGGRTAFALTMAIILLILIWNAFRFASGAKLSYFRVVLAALVPPIAAAAIAVLASIGAFDQLIERFTDDGGSARTRLLMWPLLMSFKTGELLWGAPTDYVFSQIVSHGLEWGVENPFIQMAVYQGVVVATMIMAGILLTLYEHYKRLSPKVIFPMAAFLLLCNSFGSFGGRFYTIAIFIIVVSCLFRREGVHHVV
jgi:hypothetical protein